MYLLELVLMASSKVHEVLFEPSQELKTLPDFVLIIFAIDSDSTQPQALSELNYTMNGDHRISSPMKPRQPKGVSNSRPLPSRIMISAFVVAQWMYCVAMLKLHEISSIIRISLKYLITLLF